MRAVMSNQQFKKCSLCKTINDPLFIRYDTGMSYGSHTDDPIMNSRFGPLRTDVALTLFLNEPEEYDGGELHTDGLSYKLPAGSLLMYPADTVHCVVPVTRGTRLVMVTWVQSVIRCEQQRDILRTIGSSNEKDLKDVYRKLVRMWAEV